MRSVGASARCWIGCRRSCACYASAARNMPAAVAERSLSPGARTTDRRRFGYASPARTGAGHRNNCDHAHSALSTGANFCPPWHRTGAIRHWPDGSAARAGGLRPCTTDCASTCSRRITCLPSDTPIPVFDPGRGRTKTGRLWVYTRDQRGWGGPEPPAADLSVCAGPESGTSGSAFDELQGRSARRRLRWISSNMNCAGNITLAACLAHTRRYFYEVAQTEDTPIAHEACASNRRPLCSRGAGAWTIADASAGYAACARQADRGRSSRFGSGCSFRNCLGAVISPKRSDMRCRAGMD